MRVRVQLGRPGGRDVGSPEIEERCPESGLATPTSAALTLPPVTVALTTAQSPPAGTSKPTEGEVPPACCAGVVCANETKTNKQTNKKMVHTSVGH